VFHFSAAAAFISIVQVPFSAAIISYEKMNALALIGIIESCIKLLIAIALQFVNADKLIFYAFAVLLSSGAIMSMNIAYVYRTFESCRFAIYKDTSLYKQLLSYSGFDLIGNFSVVAQGQGLNMLLNIFFGAAVNAARGITYQVQGAITQFDGNFMMAVRPQIIKYYAEGNNKKMMKLVFQSSKSSFFLLWLLCLPVLIETKYVLTLWLKIIPPHTIEFLRLALLTSLISAFRYPFITAMHATGKIKIPNLVCGTMLISTLPISYAFLRFGYNPDVVFKILLLVTFATMWMEWILIRQAVYFSISAATREILVKSLLVIVLSFLLPLAIHLYIDAGLLRLGTVTCISSLSVAFSIYFVGLNIEEKSLVRKMIRNLHERVFV
jgi:O-antigen/teichoic acid export membrane protein